MEESKSNFQHTKEHSFFVWVDQDSSNEIIHVTARDSNGDLINEIPTISPPVGNGNAKTNHVHSRQRFRVKI